MMNKTRLEFTISEDERSHEGPDVKAGSDPLGADTNPN